ncbi:MAG: hypothetical protein NTY74_11865 [Ignavibacteriae bacterium]|nr:hypothetical protein [Ignavibacteriota bacterium]
METKYYAVINVVFDLDIDCNSLIVILNETDIRKIFRILKKLKTNMKAGFARIEMEMVTFDLCLTNFSQIKIINNQLYVSRDDVLEFLIDENNLIRDIILEKALKKNYDDMRKVMQLLYPPKPKRKPRIKLFNSRHRYITPLPKTF